jgi:hypothetical protein
LAIHSRIVSRIAYRINFAPFADAPAGERQQGRRQGGRMSDPIIQVPQFRVFGILGLSLSILFRNIVPFGLISILIMSPTHIYLYVSDPYSALGDPQFSPSEIINVALFYFLIELILSYFLTAVLVFGVFQSLRGQPVSIFQSLVRGLSVFFPAIVVFIIMVLIWVVIGALIIFSVAFAYSGVGGIILAVFVGIPALYVLSILWVVVPAAVVEGRVFSAFGRSRFLTKDNRWRVLGLLILVIVINMFVQYLAEFVGGMIGSNSSAILLAWAVTALTTAFFAVVVTVSYYRLCQVKDGVDEKEIAAVFD